MTQPTILAVDDSASIRQMVSFTLGGAGFQVIQARDGQEGLEAAKRNRVSAVLTDQNMPRMDGLSLIRALRALPGYRKTPILVLTTESGAALKQEAKEAGANGWLVKPFEPRRLVEVMQKLAVAA